MYMIHGSNNLYSSSHDSILTNLQNNKLRSCMAAYIMYIRLILRNFCKKIVDDRTTRNILTNISVLMYRNSVKTQSYHTYTRIVLFLKNSRLKLFKNKIINGLRVCACLQCLQEFCPEQTFSVDIHTWCSKTTN